MKLAYCIVMGLILSTGLWAQDVVPIESGSVVSFEIDKESQEFKNMVNEYASFKLFDNPVEQVETMVSTDILVNIKEQLLETGATWTAMTENRIYLHQPVKVSNKFRVPYKMTSQSQVPTTEEVLDLDYGDEKLPNANAFVPMLGRTLKELKEVRFIIPMRIRVARIDGIPFAGTCDYDENRLNVVIKNGVIIRIWLG